MIGGSPYFRKPPFLLNYSAITAEYQSGWTDHCSGDVKLQRTPPCRGLAAMAVSARPPGKSPFKKLHGCAWQVFKFHTSSIHIYPFCRFFQLQLASEYDWITSITPPLTAIVAEIVLSYPHLLLRSLCWQPLRRETSGATPELGETLPCFQPSLPMISLCLGNCNDLSGSHH